MCQTNTSAITVIDRGGGSVLVGDNNLGIYGDTDAPGSAEAVRFTATSSGTAGKVFMYIDSGSISVPVVVGVYSDVAGSAGSLLSAVTFNAPVPGTWNVGTTSPLTITQGTPYWIALLCPSGTGTLHYRRDSTASTPDFSEFSTSLSALPATWPTAMTTPTSTSRRCT